MVYKDFLPHIGTLLIPSKCLICNSISGNSTNLCDYCLSLLASARNPALPRCLRCDVTLETAPTQPTTLPDGALLCGQCMNGQVHFQRCISATHYNPLSGKLINLLKHQRKLAALPPIVQALCGAIEAYYGIGSCHGRLADMIDLVIPVPLHRRRLQQRGFNQANEIARQICRRLSLPMDNRLCQRRVDSPPQQRVDHKQRSTNLRKAFSVEVKYRRRVMGKRVAIVDDVLTTGATVNAVAESLLTAGAAHCEIWCYARTEKSL